MPKRDKTSLDIACIKDKSLSDMENLPDPEIIAAEIIEVLEAELENFKTISSSLNHLMIMG